MEQQTGQLMVRVYAGAAQLPLEGATVVVTARGETGKLRLLSLQTTDRSGSITPVTVATPAVGESTAENGGRMPFAECGVWAEHPGFLVMGVAGVQVFPGVVTRQDMELIPLGEGEHPLGYVDRRDISPQNL